MTGPEGPPFYVGYQKRAPAELSRFLHKLLAGVILAGLGLALFLASRQQPAGPGRFELGRQRTFLGRIQERPTPVLWVDRPDRSTGGQSSYDLVAAGKHGAARHVQGLDGRWVTLSGALISHPGRALIEVVAGSVEEVSGPSDPPGSAEPVELGFIELVGEIVDAKCYAGVMKPGRGKPHRDCAVRCISGGVPAVFVVEANDGSMLTLDLVDEEGLPVGAKLLDRVAEPLTVAGQVHRRGRRLTLVAPVSSFYRRND